MSNFDDNKRQRNYKDGEIIRRLLEFSRPVLLHFIVALLLTIVLVLLDMVGPFLQGEVTGVLTDNTLNGDEMFKGVLILAALYFASIVASSVLNYISSIILQKAGQKVLYDVREKVFIHIETLSIAQINSQPVGRLVTRVTSDTNTLNELFTNVIVNFIRNVLTLLFVFIIMMVISPMLTGIMCIVVPVLVGVTIIFRKYSRKAYREVRGNISNVNSFLSENLSGMKVTQIFNQENKKYCEFMEKNNSLRKSSIKEILVFGVFRPAIYVLYVISQMIVLFFGATYVLEGKIKLKDLVKFYSYIGSFFNPIQQLADQFNQLQSSFASSERIFEMLDTKRQILDEDDAIDLDHIDGKIEFKNVWFAYNDDNWILKDVSFCVEAKQTAAFVGATGAGKTTILALIVRNYEIQKGEILIDGINVKKIKLESLRRNIGQMLQDVFLFSGTIKDNVVLRDDSISLEEVKEACHYVNADHFIDKLDGTYEYMVRERGNNFSSGQRQLLSFARTIVHKPNVMILDEATANIDTETEKLIQDSLEKMMNIGTMLIVAHRLSTVQHADKIIVLHKGEIVEQGSHQELLKKKGMYYNLYELQYKHLES